MHLRRDANGNILYPNQGRKPTCPEGYTPDPRNPFICKPILGDCIYRKIEMHKKACAHCKSIFVMLICSKIGRVTAGMCKNCEDDKEWLSDYLKKYGSQAKASKSVPNSFFNPFLVYQFVQQQK